MGQEKILSGRSVFLWPGAPKDVGLFVLSCDDCQRTDRGQVKPASVKPLSLITEPFESVAVDITGPFSLRFNDGYKYILTSVDFNTILSAAVHMKKYRGYHSC